MVGFKRGLAGVTLGLALVSSNASQSRCIVNGPAGTELQRSYGVNSDSCHTECKQAAFGENRKDNDAAFKNSFTPVKQGQTQSRNQFCACASNRQRKLVLKVRAGMCEPDNEDTKQDCWDVYKLFLSLYEKINIWTPDFTCEDCDGGACDAEISMPRNIDAAELARLKKCAEGGDQECIDMLRQINSGRFKGMVITTLYEWRVGGQAQEIPATNGGSFEPTPSDEDNAGWTECDKTCADDQGPGTMVRTVECFADDVVTDNAECEGWYGYAPPSTRECNTKPCKQWKCMGPDNEVFPAEDCGTVLPTTIRRLDNVIV